MVSAFFAAAVVVVEIAGNRQINKTTYNVTNECFVVIVGMVIVTMTMLVVLDERARRLVCARQSAATKQSSSDQKNEWQPGHR